MAEEEKLSELTIFFFVWPIALGEYFRTRTNTVRYIVEKEEENGDNTKPA
jgi:hypothetical protein